MNAREFLKAKGAEWDIDNYSEMWVPGHKLPELLEEYAQSQQPSDSAGEEVFPAWREALDGITDSRIKGDFKDMNIYKSGARIMYDRLYSMLNQKLTRPTVSEEDILIGYVDYISELISYTALLGKELDETAMLAHAHGWRTTREVEGLAARERLNKLAKSLLLPLYTEAIKELLNR